MENNIIDSIKNYISEFERNEETDFISFMQEGERMFGTMFNVVFSQYVEENGGI